MANSFKGNIRSACKKKKESSNHKYSFFACGIIVISSLLIYVAVKIRNIFDIFSLYLPLVVSVGVATLFVILGNKYVQGLISKEKNTPTSKILFNSGILIILSDIVIFLFGLIVLLVLFFLGYLD